MTRSILFGFAMMLLVSLPAAASENYPASVQKAITGMDEMCRSVDATPAPSEGLVLSTDLNGDGVADYALYEGAYYCDGAASLFGGTAGSSVTVFLSDKNNQHAAAWSEMVYGVKLGTETPAKLWMDLGGAACGQRGQVVHASMDTCSRALKWNARTKKVEYEPLSQAKPITPAE